MKIAEEETRENDACKVNIHLQSLPHIIDPLDTLDTKVYLPCRIGSMARKKIIDFSLGHVRGRDVNIADRWANAIIGRVVGG